MAPTFDILSIVVADMGATLDFYRRLGVDIPAGAESEPHVDAALPNGMRLAWDTVATVRSFDPEWAAPTGGSRVSLAFHCASPSDVDSTFAAMVDAGYDGHKKPWDAFWGMRYAVLHDPDGNGVDLYANL